MTLDELGLAVGERVRFRKRRTEGRWTPGTVAGLERDGSLGVHDPRGAFRAIPLELVEVQVRGARGAHLWEPLLDRAARAEQRSLF